MTPQQAEAGLVELDLPDGGRLLVAFGAELRPDSDVEASVVQLMLESAGSEEEVRAALTDYATRAGLTVVVSRDTKAITLVGS